MFPVCDEEPELEGDSSYGTDDHRVTPHMEGDSSYGTDDHRVTPHMEGDSSYGTDDHSPRHLNTQDSGMNYNFLF